MEGKPSSAQDNTRDGEPQGRTYNRLLRKSGSRPDSRRLANPLMGRESGGRGSRVLGRLLNREREEGWTILVAPSEMSPWGTYWTDVPGLLMYILYTIVPECPHLFVQSPMNPRKATGKSLFSSTNFSSKGQMYHITLQV